MSTLHVWLSYAESAWSNSSARRSRQIKVKAIFEEVTLLISRPVVADLSPRRPGLETGEQGLSRDREATCIGWRFGSLAVELLVVGVSWVRCHRASPENG